MAARKEPAIVAELGRPETPEEAADRRAAASRARRSHQTLLNLVLSIIASLGIVLFLVLVVVRPAPAPADPVDFAAIASQSQPAFDVPLVVPSLDESWVANRADVRSIGGLPTWYIGFVTPESQFIALAQAADSNPTWLETVVERGTETGRVTIDGIDWAIYDDRTDPDAGNLAYALVTQRGSTSYVVYGTAADDEFEVFAESIADDVRRAPEN